MLAMAPLASFQPDVLGAELVRLRTDAHLSQRALARLADVSNTAISDLEAGTAPPPHPMALQKIARGLATSGLGALDERRAEAAYLLLMRAAGYVPEPPTFPEPPGLRAELEAIFGPDDAPTMETALVVLARRTGGQRRSAIRLLRALIDDDSE